MCPVHDLSHYKKDKFKTIVFYSRLTKIIFPLILLRARSLIRCARAYLASLCPYVFIYLSLFKENIDRDTAAPRQLTHTISSFNIQRKYLPRFLLVYRYAKKCAVFRATGVSPPPSRTHNLKVSP